MQSIQFPKMFNRNSTRVWKANQHKDATMQNSITLLSAERGELLGDPYYGPLFKHLLFEPNNVILGDAIRDIVYNQLALFIPQVKVNRNDIEIIIDKEKGKLYCNFTGIDQLDFSTDTYQLILFDNTNTNI